MPQPRRRRANLKLGEEICREMARGRTMLEVCRERGIDESTVRGWALGDPRFAPVHARARELQAHAWFEQIIDIADNASGDWIETENGPVKSREAIERSHLRVDARKWACARLLPKVYGDKLAIGGDPDHPLQVERRIDLRSMSREERDALEAFLRLRAERRARDLRHSHAGASRRPAMCGGRRMSRLPELAGRDRP
jgi:hypothetical protein